MAENEDVIEEHKPLFFLCSGSPELLTLPKGAQVFPNAPTTISTTTTECQVVLIEHGLALDEIAEQVRFQIDKVM